MKTHALKSETTDQRTERVAVKRVKIDDELIALDVSGDLKYVNRPGLLPLPARQSGCFAYTGLSAPGERHQS